MALINISQPEENKNKNPIAGNTGTGNGTGTGTKPATGNTGTGTGSSGTGAGGEIVAQPDNGTFQPGGSIAPLLEFLQKNPEIGHEYRPNRGQIIGNPITGSSANTNQQEAETSLAELKNDYARQIRDNYDYSAEKLKNERDEALRENWILQQRAEAALPEQMAASGINGGAAETSLAALKALYQGNRNDIRSDYLDDLGELGINSQNLAAESQRKYDEQWLDYLLSLAKMKEQSKYD